MACVVSDSGQHLTLPSDLRIYKPTIQEVSYFDLFKETIMYMLIMVTLITLNTCIRFKAG